ncbi:hypothetical protein [Burkholderia diffusa]|uniref:hypothetical protein n=1 Tax=Burkholderia diffusa TaxID=488732 RepID=UPI000ABAF7A6|nr:hypothetical protein [Burkholderia diffusa]
MCARELQNADKPIESDPAPLGGRQTVMPAQGIDFRPHHALLAAFRDRVSNVAGRQALERTQGLVNEQAFGVPEEWMVCFHRFFDRVGPASRNGVAHRAARR